MIGILNLTDSKKMEEHILSKDNPHGVTLEQLGLDTDNLVSSFNGRSGDVSPQSGDYTPDMVGIEYLVYVQNDEPVDAEVGDVWIDLDDDVLDDDGNPLYAGIIHAYRHGVGGDDPLTPDMIGAVDKENAEVTTKIVVNAPGLWPDVIVRGATREGVFENSQDNSVNIQNRPIGDTSNRVGLELFNEGSGLHGIIRIFTQIDGVVTAYPLYHTGNKPTGSYTGNGSETARYTHIGGVGTMVLISSDSGMALVTNRGAICKTSNSTDVVGIASQQVIYENGTLTITSTSDYLNKSGQQYWYQVL